jgi:hypothetical protein
MDCQVARLVVIEDYWFVEQPSPGEQRQMTVCLESLELYP